MSWVVSAATKVQATAGPRTGQSGRIVEPGESVSLVKWKDRAHSAYPHRSLVEK